MTTQTIPASLVDRDQTDGSRYYAEASTIGLAPGYWPEQVVVTRFANDADVRFVRLSAFSHNGEPAGFNYGAINVDALLTIFND